MKAACLSLLLLTVSCAMPASRDVVFSAAAGGNQTGASGGSVGSTTSNGQGANEVNLHLTGFARRIGTTLQTVLVDATGAALGTPVSTKIAADTFDVSLSASGKTAAHVAVLMDINRNGHCDPTPRDGGWLVPVGSSALTLDVNDGQTTVCNIFAVSAYNLWINGDSDHEGRAVRGALVDDQNHVVVATDTVVKNGSYTFAWPAMLAAGKGYSTYWFIDLVQSGVCELFPGDFVYTLPIAAVSDDVALIVHGDNRVRTDLCAYLGHFAATVNLSGLGTHAGQRLHVQAFDTQSANPIDGIHSQTLTTDTAVVQWPALLNPNRTYQVVAFVDANGNNTCDTSDPQWVVTITNPQAAVVSSIDAATAATGGACARFAGSIP